MPKARFQEKIALAIYIVGFGIGVYNHARDFWVGGWRPYGWAPEVLEAFWTSLVILDATVIVFILLGWRRVSLALAVAIMIVDVAANTYAWHMFDIPSFAVAVPLKAAFLGFVLGSLPFLWHSE